MTTRRAFLTGAVAGLLAPPRRVRAAISYATGQLIPDQRSPYILDVHFSEGQSWRTNAFSSYGGFALPHSAPVALKVSNIGTPTFKPGPLSNGAGISLPTGTFTGFTNYAATDQVSIGRAAVLAQQLLRAGAGIATSPVLEYCTAFPGSTWTSGLGGGLAPGPTCSGSISGTTLTLGTPTGGVFVPNQQVSGTGVAAQTAIYAQLTGPSGDAGTYSQFLYSTLLDSAGGQNINFASVAGWTAVGYSLFGVFYLTSVTGTINPGDVVTASNAGSPGIPAGTTVLAQISGSAGGIGTYAFSLPQTVVSETLACKGVSWANMLTIIAAAAALVPNGKIENLSCSSVGYTQGASTDNTDTGKVGDLTDMLQDYDALLGNTTDYYLGLPSAQTQQTQINSSYFGTVEFCRTHAPGQGGTWSGRCFFSASSYPWPFVTDPTDPAYGNIHTGPYGTVRWGEWEGYVRCLTRDQGVAFTPLWQSLGAAVSVSGQVITIPFDRPAGADFISGVLSWSSGDWNGVIADPGLLANYGFVVKRGGSSLTLTSLVISSLNIIITVADALSTGDALEVSYAWYGLGGTNPGLLSGVRGNLVMAGPPSVLFPGKTIDAWAVPFLADVAVP
jgi:hypothetical protein